jgi:exodeoxyribonuclease V alpha subunit
VTALREVFRQQKTSAIVLAAHEILHGHLPVSGGEGSDFYVIETQNSAQTQSLVRELVVQRIPRKFGLDPFRDIQVLCPMYRGDVGADALNEALRDALNPQGEAFVRGNTELRVGDKVLQIRNDHDREVFNGDAGRVAAIDLATGKLQVQFGERKVDYTAAELDQLVPGYAISVHRSQGSEYPAVVLPMATEHYLMLRRNLLYTAVTRGRRLVVVVGTAKAIRMAVENGESLHRNSGLAERLRET